MACIKRGVRLENYYYYYTLFLPKARCVCRQAAVKAAKFLPLDGLARSKQGPINHGHGAQYLYRPPPAGAKNTPDEIRGKWHAWGAAGRNDMNLHQTPEYQIRRVKLIKKHLKAPMKPGRSSLAAPCESERGVTSHHARVKALMKPALLLTGFLGADIYILLIKSQSVCQRQFNKASLAMRFHALL